VGDRLNSIALEIQLHNLEAQRKISRYIAEFKTLGADKARETYLDEAEFEIHEIGSLARRGVKIAPTAEKRDTFQVASDAATAFSAALEKVVAGVEKDGSASADDLTAYQTAAEHLNQSAEDGEIAGREASQSSQENIELVSRRSVPIVAGVSVLGLVIALFMSIILCRAILIPIDHLKEVAENVSMGNLQIAVRRFTDDEIGDLADSFSRMVVAVRFFQMEAEISHSLPEPENNPR
jgi:nitrogen fixation/metabolism regulation signal transduction histidine kinase